MCLVKVLKTIFQNTMRVIRESEKQTKQKNAPRQTLHTDKNTELKL